MPNYTVSGYFVEATGVGRSEQREYWLRDRRITIEVGDFCVVQEYVYDDSETETIAGLVSGQQVTLTVSEEPGDTLDYVWHVSPGDTPNQQLRRLATQVKELKVMLDR